MTDTRTDTAVRFESADIPALRRALLADADTHETRAAETYADAKDGSSPWPDSPSRCAACSGSSSARPGPCGSRSRWSRSREGGSAMRYLATPSTPLVRDAMTRGLIDTMTGPYQGNVLPDGAWWAADNGRFAHDGPRTGWLGHRRWLDWLAGQVERYSATLCRFAVAPDVPFSAAGTLAECQPWLEEIRALGIPAAFAAQNGCEALGLPWDEFDVLFLAGGPTDPGDPRTEWKISPVAQRLTAEAHERGKWVHMGRVNSRKRLWIARSFGCDSVDGTYLAFGPDINLGRLLGWLGEASRVPMLTELAA